MQDSNQKKWLESNKDAIEWRLVGPNFKNPFDNNVSESRLEEFCRDKALLMDECTVQAVMDNSILMKIEDMTSFSYETQHPYVVNIDREDLRDFVKDSGASEKIKSDFVKIQEACAQELEERRSGISSYV